MIAFTIKTDNEILNNLDEKLKNLQNNMLIDVKAYSDFLMKGFEGNHFAEREIYNGISFINIRYPLEECNSKAILECVSNHNNKIKEIENIIKMLKICKKFNIDEIGVDNNQLNLLDECANKEV